MTDRSEEEADRIEIELAKNIAQNARWFCALVSFASLVAFSSFNDLMAFRLAILSITPIGLSVIVDQLEFGPTRFALSAISYALPIIAAFYLLFFAG